MEKGLKQGTVAYHNSKHDRITRLGKITTDYKDSRENIRHKWVDELMDRT